MKNTYLGITTGRVYKGKLGNDPAIIFGLHFHSNLTIRFNLIVRSVMIGVEQISVDNFEEGTIIRALRKQTHITDLKYLATEQEFVDKILTFF